MPTICEKPRWDSGSTLADPESTEHAVYKHHIGCAFLGTATTHVGVDLIDQHPRIGFTATFTQITGFRSSGLQLDDPLDAGTCRCNGQVEQFDGKSPEQCRSQRG